MLRADTLAPAALAPAQGHRTVLVSASLGPYLRAARRRCSASTTCCAPTWSRDGGRVHATALDGGELPRRRRRRARLRALARRARSRRTAELWAYGDSAGDREMLADARLIPCGSTDTTAASPCRRRRDERRDEPGDGPCCARRGPKQWVKNVLVLRRARRGRRARQRRRTLWRTRWSCSSRSAWSSSGTYYWNDILDVDGDRDAPDEAVPPDRQRRDPARHRARSSARCCWSPGSALGVRRRAGRRRRSSPATSSLTTSYSVVLEAHRRRRPRRRRQRASCCARSPVPSRPTCR